MQIISLSFYRHKTSAEPRATNIGQVQDAICGSFYEQQVKIIRQLKEQGKKEAADEVKNNLHAGLSVQPSITCFAVVYTSSTTT